MWIKKPIIVDCFTDKQHVYDFAKVDRGIRFMPEWWKNMPPTYLSNNQFTVNPTIKRCPGFINYYKNSFVVPLWSDLGVDTRDGIAWQFSDQQSVAELHPQEQLGPLLPGYQHIKLLNPWLMQCNEPVEFLADSLLYSMPEDVLGSPGIIEFFYQTGANINLFFRRGNLYNLQHGTPLLSLIPLTERKVEFKCHLVTPLEWSRINSKNTSIVFSGKYRYIRGLYERIHQSLR